MIPLLAPVVLPVSYRYSTAIDMSGLPASDNGSVAGYTLVTKFRRIENLAGGTPVRVVLYGGVTGATNFDSVYIGRAATSGYAWSFASAPTQLFFNGAAAVSVPRRSKVASDPSSFVFNPARPHIIAFDVPNSDSLVRQFEDPTQERGFVSYYLASSSEASSTTKSAGYTAFESTVFSVVSILAGEET